MDENRFCYKQNTYTNNASDDSSYTYPMPLLTDNRKRKSRLGTRTRANRVLQDVINQDIECVEQNNENLKPQDEEDVIRDHDRVSTNFPKLTNSYDNVDLIKPLNLQHDANYLKDTDDFITAVDLNQDFSLSKLIEPSHDIICPKPLDLHQELNISKSFNLPEPSLIKLENGYQDFSISKSFDLLEPSFIKIDSELDQNISRSLHLHEPNSLKIDSGYLEISPSKPVELQELSFGNFNNSKSGKFKPLELVRSPTPPLNLVLEESPKLSKSIPLPSKEMPKKCESQPVNTNNAVHEFKQPENPPPPSREEIKSDFQVPLPVPLNPKTSDRPLSSITVKGKTYKIVNILGSGGSSLVYQVLHPENNETLAIKRVNLAEVDESIAEGYIDEVNLLKSLQKSELIIKMYDHELVYDNNRELLYVVMEKGDIDLAELIRNINRTKKPSILMILYYWHEMLSAVLEIHNNGVIHSDLKPANFLLVKGRLKLIDFGIASSIQGDKTSIRKETFAGTLNYMSPEALQWTSKESRQFRITYKTDVWSLGCILYNLIYGRLPFQHKKKRWEKVQTIVDPKVQIEFPEVNGVPATLMQALKSCLEKDPEKRMSVSQLLQLPYCGD